MIQEKEEESFRSQVEERLDLLFQENSPGAMEEQVRLRKHPLNGLKAILLSIDWEITDSTLNSLLNEIKSLEYIYSEDKIVLTFLQVIGSLGKYIKGNKARAHPGATQVMISAYEGLERVATTEGMSRAEKEKALLEEVANFRKLKEQVALKKMEVKEPSVSGEERSPVPIAEEKEAPVPRTPVPEQASEAAGAKTRFDERSPHEAFAYALEEIREMIRAEFRALRAEIKLWRESK